MWGGKDSTKGKVAKVRECVCGGGEGERIVGYGSLRFIFRDHPQVVLKFNECTTSVLLFFCFSVELIVV